MCFFNVVFWKAIVPIHCNWMERRSIFQLLLFCLMEEWMSYLFENMHLRILAWTILSMVFLSHAKEEEMRKSQNNHNISRQHILFTAFVFVIFLFAFCFHSLKLSLLHLSAFAVRAQRGHMPLCIDWCYSCRQCPANQKCLENFKHFPL